MNIGQLHKNIRAMRAGRRWAIGHPEAEPEEYQAKAKLMEPEIGRFWLNGVIQEFWHPSDQQRVTP